MTTEFRSTLTRELSKIRSSATFLTIRGYQNNFHEVSDYSICFHIDYNKAVQRSLAIIQDFQPSPSKCIGKVYSSADLAQARAELIDSYLATLGGNSQSTTKNSYDTVAYKMKDGQEIPGIKIHLSQDLVHLWGYRVHKRVITPGEYKQVKSAAKTLAKNDLRALTPLHRFGQWKLEMGRFDHLMVEGIAIADEETRRLIA